MDDVQKVKDRLDIVDFINEYVALKKMGRNFKALCPFHSEKTPSFVVSPERQIWHCFGCQKGGDIFTFLMEYEKVEFSEALKELAQRAGVTLSTPAARSETEKKKELYLSLNHLAFQFYNFLLLEHRVGKKALSYLTNERKVSLELISKFGIGFSPSSGSALSDYLKKKKTYGVLDIVNAGLGVYKGSHIYDFFRDRIIFPIKDSRGNIIAFSGRILESSPSTNSGPKYINTKETLIYKKGDTFFGLYEAKDAIKKEKRVIVVEGELDVLSSFREGIPFTIAIKGTALTQNQIKLLKRYAEKVSFCFDMDKAGTDAMQRAASLIEKEGLFASVILLPSGKDPDELLNENSLSYKKSVKHDIPVYDFLIDSAASTFDHATSDGKRKILESVLPHLVLIENEVVKEHYFRKLAEVLNTSFESIIRQTEKIKIPVIKTVEDSKRAKKVSREETIEFYLLSLILQAKDVKRAFDVSFSVLSETDLNTEIFNRLYNHIKNSLEVIKTPTVIELAKILASELLPISDKCYLSPLPHFEDVDDYYDEITKTAFEIRNLSIKKKIENIAFEIKQKEKEKDEESIFKLNTEFDRLAKLLKTS